MLPGTEEKQTPTAQGSTILGERSKSPWGYEELWAQGFLGKCTNIADGVGLQSSVLRLF